MPELSPHSVIGADELTSRLYTFDSHGYTDYPLYEQGSESVTSAV